MTYRERLTLPALWWLLGLGFVLSFGWVFLVSTTPTIALAISVLTAIGVAIALHSYGNVVLVVEGGIIRAGRAHIDRRYCGAPRVLDKEEFRATLGPQADARAYAVTRPYVHTGVLIPIHDDRDPTPYWIISSRRPAAFVAAVRHTESATTEREGTGVEEV